jgi:hypothetical protein
MLKVVIRNISRMSDFPPVLSGESLFDDARPLQLVLHVAVVVVRVRRQHSREDAVQQRERLPVDGAHALGGRLITGLAPGKDGDHRRQHQIADVIAEGHPLAGRELLELIMHKIVHSDVQDSHL